MADPSALLAGNRAYAGTYVPMPDARPSRHVAVVTCMDARIDVLEVLGLHLGEVHVLRNAGGRVTDDVLRSLALSSHLLDVDGVVLMQHTRCGLAGVTDDELRSTTGAAIEFLSITDHTAALEHDVTVVAAAPFLEGVGVVAGWLFDTDTGLVVEVHRWQRP